MYKKNFIEQKTIDMTVTDDGNFLSPYSEDGQPVISSEVADFLENAAKAYRPKDSLIVNIHGDCIDDCEKIKYASAIKNYYALKKKEEERELRRKVLASIIFAVIGIIALAVMFIVSDFNVNEVWKECIDIFAWVFVWEAVDLFFIERGAIVVRRKRCENFIEAEIRFE